MNVGGRLAMSMPPPERYLAVTLDTEVDKGRDWRVSDPATFDSVLRGVPERLSPLFDEFGAIPTYLLSPEIIEDDRCADVLAELGARAELGTHLHAEVVEPERILARDALAGSRIDTVQCTLAPGLEAAKLRRLTELFTVRFGYQPTSFRAGRYGMGDETLQTLASLGYRVDSSVTPGLRWRYEGVTLDFRRWGPEPKWVETTAGSILEAPITIWPGSAGAALLERGPRLLARAAGKLVGDRCRYLWLRPSWSTGAALVRGLERSEQRILVLMLHSMEIVPGGSPYAATTADVDRILGTLRAVLDHCALEGIGFCGLSQAAELA